MSSAQNVAVIGLGMIGGSVARGLAARGVKVSGYDKDRASIEAAIAEGVITRALSPELDDLDDTEAVVIAVYGDAAVDMLPKLAPFADRLRLVTDVGSTKQVIVSAAEKSPVAPCFVGAHPFAGDHRSGFAASRFDLFEKEIVYICQTASSTPDSVALAQWLWTSLGAHPLKIDAAEHDELVAWTSHLPHMVSIALALSLAGAGIARRQLGRGGRDMVRLAAGSPDVWAAISMDNADAIEKALRGFEQQIGDVRMLLKAAARDAVRERLSKARQWTGPGDHATRP
jgi:prephenate dehydrogenase